jgi:mannose-6-phosphate isomerase-like protein (cupin superfamily)
MSDGESRPEQFPVETRRISVAEALKFLPGPQGERSALLFEHGTLAVKVYAPRGTDPQIPHARDEIYVVAQGSGEFVSSQGRQPFGPNDFLFAPAGEVHRFENFTGDLLVWVFFYGPDGGERAR